MLGLLEDHGGEAGLRLDLAQVRLREGDWEEARLVVAVAIAAVAHSAVLDDERTDY
jgi:hypothetical protein